MKAISLKPAGTALNFRIPAVISQFLTRHSVAIAVVSAITALAASAIDADSISIPAAFIALGAVYYETEIKEGGES